LVNQGVEDDKRAIFPKTQDDDDGDIVKGNRGDRKSEMIKGDADSELVESTTLVFFRFSKTQKNQTSPKDMNIRK